MDKHRGITRSAVLGGVWMFILKAADRILGFLKIIILARLLLPKDFGMLGIALLVIQALVIFTETGLNEALIQRKEKIDGYLGTVLWINILRGIVLAALLWISAPFIADFFKEANLTNILRVISIAIILEGFLNPRIISLTRELKFNQYFLYESVGSIIEACISIFLALYLRNVWALVWGYIARKLVQLIYSYLFYSPPQILTFTMKKAKELFTFGKHILISGFLKFFINSGVDGLIAYLFGMSFLGLYQIGFKISQIPTTEVTQHFFQVAFPVYSRLQDDMNKVREAYLLVLRSVVFFSFPLAGLMFILARDIVVILLGEKWLPMVPALMVLSVYGLLRSIDYGSIFKAVGKPEIITKITWVRFVVVAALVFPLSKTFGITGAALSLLIGALSVEGWASYRVCKIIQYPFVKFWQGIFYPFSAMLLMVLCISLMKNIYYVDTVFKLVFICGLNILIYLCVIFFMDRYGLFDLKPIINRIKEAMKDNVSYNENN